MSKYIDAEKLIEVLASMRTNHRIDTSNRHFLECFRAGDEFLKTMDDVISSVCLMPASDVAEVRHGRWEELMEHRGAGGILGGKDICVGYACSECGEQSDIMTYYCPNCGASMVDEVEE